LKRPRRFPKRVLAYQTPVVVNMDDDIPLGQCAFIFITVALAIAGLVMISFAGGWYWPGLAVFVISALAGFYAIKRYYDRLDLLRRQH
jgi:membrane protein implicated in regulation of membrane protease activity